MPYRALLQSLVQSVSGACAALMLDSAGELVLQVGDEQERHRLIAAYQGIALGSVRRTLERHAAGGLDYMHCRYAAGDVILRPLKDGYFLVLSLARAGDLVRGLRRSLETQERLNAEL